MKPNGSVPVPDRQMLRRAVILALLLGIAAFALLLGRLYVLQIVEHERYESLALQQQLREAPSSAARGAILDRNGNALAVSASVDTVYLSPAEIEMHREDRTLIAEELGRILDLDPEEIREKAERAGSWYVTVARKIERDKADEIRAFKETYGLQGVRLEPDTKRYYPNSGLACHVIGFVGTDNYGLEGIEARYDSALAGTAGRTVRATNAFGTELLLNGFEAEEPGEAGFDVVTTLDSTIQFFVEKHLRQAVEDYDIQNGAGAIAMDVDTGAVLAMASLDGYDLNHFLDVGAEAKAAVEAAPSAEERERLLHEAQSRQWRNKALSDTYEPGSTFKIITLSMALEEGAVSLHDSFYCGGSVQVIGRTNPIRCWKAGGHGAQDLTQAVQHSCNVAFVNIGQRVGAETFYRYCESFGFLNRTGNADENLSAVTGIDLAGESGSIWWSENTFCSPRNLSQLAAASFGQTFTITPLQLITAVSACVNGGRLMQPYVVGALRNPDGSLAYERRPTLVRQVVSEETSVAVRRILERVVGDPKDGTGRNAAVAGYRIGGKTGTSEKVSLEAQTGEKEYIVSFVGFAPADKPKIALLVFLDTPSSESGIYISGGQMAAPVVGAMLADILPYLGVEADNAEAGAHGDVRMPPVEGLSLREAKEKLEASELRFRKIGDGDTVTDQLPAAGVSLAEGTEVIVYLGAEPSQETETVPDLTGMPYDEARDTLSYYGLYIRTNSPLFADGSQRIGSQNAAPGSQRRHGDVIQVTLISGDDSLLGKY